MHLAFPTAVLLLVIVAGIACNDLTATSSAQLWDAANANLVSPFGQNRRVVPKFVQGGYFAPLARPLPVLDKCDPRPASIVRDSGYSLSGRDSATRRPGE